MASVQPFDVFFPEDEIKDLRTLISATRYPDELEASDWDLGAPLTEVRRLATYWKDEFDFNKAANDLNKLPQFTTDIQVDGFESLRIHFVHKKSPRKNAIPLLFCHGWPGSFIEVAKIINPLTEGTGDGPAFDVVAPSLPNFGFSQETKKRGFQIEQYAETVHKLMLKLGYNQYVTQGGDWGWYVTRACSMLYPSHVKATHFNMDVALDPSHSPATNPILALQNSLTSYNAAEKTGLERTQWFYDEGFGYNILQSTRPQTLAYSLSSSPTGLLSWILEKLHDWTDAYSWTDDEILTWVSIYWFSTAGPGASGRIYYEMTHNYPQNPEKMTRERMQGYLKGVKIGQSHFPRDIHVLPRDWFAGLGEVVFQKEHQSGGHFAAWEKPQEIVRDLREMFGKGGGAEGVLAERSGFD